jgi:pyrroline-5-carboxylate reductase
MARGFIAGGVIKASSAVATDPMQARKDVFKSFDVPVVSSNIEVCIPARQSFLGQLFILKPH